MGKLLLSAKAESRKVLCPSPGGSEGASKRGSCCLCSTYGVRLSATASVESSVIAALVCLSRMAIRFPLTPTLIQLYHVSQTRASGKQPCHRTGKPRQQGGGQHVLGKQRRHQSQHRLVAPVDLNLL